MSAIAILAAVAGLLAVISLWPPTEKYPLLSVAALLLAIAVYLSGAG